MWCRQCKSPTTGNLSSECSLKNVPSASRFSLTAKLGLLYRCFWVTKYFPEWFPFLDFLLPPTFPSQMQSLTSCQCSVCCGCFQQHFTIAVRDKHIRDMVCPVCWEPDINDPEHLNSYFSTLDIQVGKQINRERSENVSSLWLLHCHLVSLPSLTVQ